jgi:hypothetical protein
MKTRQILNELHNSTHFGVTELESLLSHFSVVAGNNRMISRRKFISAMGHGERATTTAPMPLHDERTWVSHHQREVY